MRKLEQKTRRRKASETEQKARPRKERGHQRSQMLSKTAAVLRWACSTITAMIWCSYRTRLHISMHCNCIYPNLFLSAPTFFLPCICPMCAAARTQKHWQRPPGLNLPMYPRLHVRHIFTRSGDWFAFLIIWFALNRATHSLFFSLPSLPSILQPCYYCQSRRPCRKLQQLQKWMAEWFEGWIEL